MGGARQLTGEHMAQGKHMTSHVLTITELEHKDMTNQDCQRSVTH